MFRDFRYAWRTLLKNPGFALVAIISLALGIGANSAIFSLVDSLLLRPLPVPHAWQLIAVQSQVQGESLGGLLEYSPLSYPDYIDLKKKANSFSGLTASEYSPFGFTTEKNALPKMKYGVLASGDFFRVLEVRPVLGRDFRPDEDQVVGRDAVVVLGYDFWQTEFGGKPDAIGKTIYLNNVACTVIGVAPASFTAPYPTIRGALYVPLAMGPRLAGDSQANMLERRELRQVFVHGRLKPGVSVSQAAAETAVIGQQLAQAYPETNRTCSLVAGLDVVSRLRENPARIAIVGFLLALAAVVLLIACANVMNLMLSRGRARVAGDRGAAGDRCRARAVDPSTPDGEPDHRARGRGPGTGGGASRHRAVFADPDSERYSDRAGLRTGYRSASVHHRGVGGERDPVRARTGITEH